jgi:replicative DNA helicase
MSAGDYGDNFGLEYQHHMLAVVLRTPGLAIRYRSAIDHTYLTFDLNRVIAKVFLSHVDEHRAIPTYPTLVEECRVTCPEAQFPDVQKTLNKLFAEDVSDAPAVAKSIIKFGQQQAMVNAVMEAAAKIDKGEREIRSIIDKAMLVGEDITNLGINYNKSESERLEWHTSAVNDRPVPTGIEHLDMVLGGGLGRGMLGVVFAPAKRGKSVLLTNFMAGAGFSGHNALYVSCEMNRKLVAARLDIRLAGPHADYRKTDPEKFAMVMNDRVRKFIRGDIRINNYATRALTPSGLRSYLHLLRADGFIPDVLLVDYADIMKGERRLGEARHEQAGIYEDLRGIAGEFDVACWTASQSNRASFKKERLEAEDSSESIEKVQIMDWGLFYSQTIEEKAAGRSRLITMGRTESDGGTIELDDIRRRMLMRSTAYYDASNVQHGRDSLFNTEEKLLPVRPDAKDLRGRVGLPSQRSVAIYGKGKDESAAMRREIIKALPKPKSNGRAVLKPA